MKRTDPLRSPFKSTNLQVIYLQACYNLDSKWSEITPNE